MGDRPRTQHTTLLRGGEHPRPINTPPPPRHHETPRRREPGPSPPRPPPPLQPTRDGCASPSLAPDHRARTILLWAAVFFGLMVLIARTFRQVDQGRAMIINRLRGEPKVTFSGSVVLPVVNNATGEKLSKQTRAAAVPPSGGSALLSAAAHFLGHPVPSEMVGAPVPEFWDWAIANWSIERVPPLRGAFPGRR